MALTTEDLTALSGLLQKSEKMLLDEMERLHNDTIGRFDKLDQHLSNIDTAINSTRYSNDMVELLSKKVEALEKRLKKLEETA